jgi:hypothetical protein
MIFNENENLKNPKTKKISNVNINININENGLSNKIYIVNNEKENMKKPSIVYF